MAKFKTKTGVVIEAEKFFLHSPCQGVAKFCNNYIVRSDVGLQSVKNFDYVMKTTNGKYLAIPKSVFEMLMEIDNG